jgi:glycosyltransferase involved in cell wall biosynthesis
MFSVIFLLWYNKIMKRILFFNYEYPPLGGGAANATLYILKEFAKQPGLEVDLVTASISDRYELETIGTNVRIHRLPIGKSPQNLHFQSQKDLLIYTWKSYFFGKKLISQMKKNGLSYNLSHSFFSVPCGFVSWLLKRKYDLPYIVSLRGSDVPGYSDRFKFIYAVLTPLIRIIWKRASSVIANSRGLQELALETSKKQKIEIIFNGIDIEEFFPNEDMREKNRFVITLGGTRITTRKGINYLIDAIAILAPKYPNILLRIMGDGDEKEALTNRVKKYNLDKYVEFVGRISRDRIVPYYQEASLFVLPSLNEGMSNAMLEALASGLPIVATRTGGTDELVIDGENGLIVEMKSTADLVDKIEKIMLAENLRKKMGQSSRAKAEKQSWKEVANQYIAVYESIT